MKMNEPTLITANSISDAWGAAFLKVLNGGEKYPLVVSIRNFSEEIPSQDTVISDALDVYLRESGIPTIAQTALTLAPYERWNRLGKPKISELSQWYLTELLPRLKARCSKNQRGTYFERLVSYTGVRIVDGKQKLQTIDQLDFVISTWEKRAKKGRRPRQSALQLSCFDPAKDHTGSALSGFPCLQQVSLTYKEKGSLEINAYYPTQYLVDRAYGNYLGLCQLGHIIAHELGLRLTSFTCFVACPEIGPESKKSLRHLSELVKKRQQLARNSSPSSVPRNNGQPKRLAERPA